MIRSTIKFNWLVFHACAISSPRFMKFTVVGVTMLTDRLRCKECHNFEKMNWDTEELHMFKFVMDQSLIEIFWAAIMTQIPLLDNGKNEFPYIKKKKSSLKCLFLPLWCYTSSELCVSQDCLKLCGHALSCTVCKVSVLLFPFIWNFNHSSRKVNDYLVSFCI